MIVTRASETQTRLVNELKLRVQRYCTSGAKCLLNVLFSQGHDFYYSMNDCLTVTLSFYTDTVAMFKHNYRWLNKAWRKCDP